MSWNIMQGNKIDGFTFHFITTGIDDGDIVLSEEFVYPDSCKVPLDYDNYKSDKEFVSGMDFFEKISNGHFFNIKKQQEEYSSYFSRLNTNIHGYINWNWSLDEILKFINAFDEPYEGTSSYINGVLVKIKKATVTYTDGIFHPFQKGIIYRKNNIGVFVATEQGTLIIEDIKDNEGNDFINSIKLGDRIFTPQSKIDEAFTTRVFYNDKGLNLK